jgi:hypothetical protein
MSNLVKENLEKFQHFFKSAHSKGVLDEKTKQLMHIALVIAMRCEPCAILSIEKGRRMGYQMRSSTKLYNWLHQWELALFWLWENALKRQQMSLITGGKRKRHARYAEWRIHDCRGV